MSESSQIKDNYKMKTKIVIAKYKKLEILQLRQ